MAQFPVCKQRLLAEDHTQHPCGTAERLTLRHWLSVNSISRKMVIERHGEKSDELKVFQQMVCSQLR